VGASDARRSEAALVEVDELTVSFACGPDEFADAVSAVSLTISAGEAVGLIGESGCGKSTLASALLGFLRAGAVRRSGTVRIDGEDVFSLSAPEMRRLRGGRVALVPQNAGHALTPTMRIGHQLEESLRLHRGLSSAKANDETVELLTRVRLPTPRSLLRRYPSELSGGQQQRVAIAMALAGRPDLLVLDEPTTGLDVITQSRVLELLEEIRESVGAAMLYVSHDLGVIGEMCETAYVMYAGRIVEAGETTALFHAPTHPYTRGLLDSVPRAADGRLPRPLPGAPPAIGDLPAGCAFAPRCSLASDVCRSLLPELAGTGAHTGLVRCHHATAAAALTSESVDGLEVAERPVLGKPVVTARNVTIDYARDGRLASLRRRIRRYRGRPEPAHAVTAVDLDIRQGETLALVGESGSGKSTLARAIAGLHRPRAGELHYHDADLALAATKRPVSLRRSLQLVLQNPDTALNPRQRIGEILDRPLRLFGVVPSRERPRRVAELLREVELGGEYAHRFPGQLSGGQRQRVGIARALATSPDVLLCDEVVSALDVSVQASVLKLLDELRAERGLTCLFISHDLGVVRAVADRVAVLYLGRICEIGTVAQVFDGPSHPYTRLLVEAVPDPDRPRRRREPVPRADREEAGVPTKGCVFQHSCPRRLGPICAEQEPPWRARDEMHGIRCHIPLDELVGDAVPGMRAVARTSDRTRDTSRSDVSVVAAPVTNRGDRS
jgi:peptide/nickel transport system ATP-binding protein